MNPRRELTLSVWLVLFSLGPVLLAVLGLFPFAVGLMEELALNYARSQVMVAGLGERARLDAQVARVEVAARILAERPTLNRLLTEQQQAALATFLGQYSRTAGLENCAISRAGQPLCVTQPKDWANYPAEIRDGFSNFAYFSMGTTLYVAVTAIPIEHPDLWVTVVERLSPEQAPTPTESGLLVVVSGGPAPEPPPVEDQIYFRQLVGQAGWIDASITVASVMRAVDPLKRYFFWVTFATCLIALFFSVVGGRWLAKPLEKLRRAATLIGSGDLITPVPKVAGLEAGALGLTMEDMRLRLHRLTHELRVREGETKAILSAVVEGVYSVDEQRRIVYLNPQAASMLGTTLEQAQGQFCGDILHPGPPGQRPCEDACPIVHARSRGRTQAVEQLHLAGGLRTVVITSAPPVGNTQVQVFRDETELETARRARDTVFSNISHEFKTPLSAQLASIELLREGLGHMSLEDSLNFVGMLERSSYRLMRLIDNLLESVRIETDSVTLRHDLVDLVLVLEDACAMVRPLLQQAHQELALDFAEAASIRGDASQLTQVFVNLLANAHKYAPDGSLIRLSLREDVKWLCISVEDQGPGVLPSLSDSIFDRFQRLSPSAKGMGLGLWIVKSIVARHQGLVQVSTSALGGACFSVLLPLLEEDV